MYPQTYMYIGTESTRAVLHRWQDRVEIAPWDVIKASVKLGGSFVVFDEKVLGKINNDIEAQELSVKSESERFDEIIKATKTKHKKEIEAIESEKKTSIDYLNSKVTRAKDHKKIIEANIAKATESIDKKIADLNKTKETLTKEETK